jgi:hypothetical protein
MAQRAEALMFSGQTADAGELWERVWKRGQQPRALAALILCQTIDSPVIPGLDDSAQEISVSREFITWYQRLIAMRSGKLSNGVNEQLDKLSRTLPTAAKRIETALAGTQRKEALVQ